MDELKIKTKFMKGIVCKLIKFAIKKAYGCDVDIKLETFEVASNGEQMHIELNAKADVNTADVERIVKGFLE